MTFSTASSAQVQHVQACCRYLWGLGTAIDGVWGAQTARHSTRVLRAAGVTSGGITTSVALARRQPGEHAQGVPDAGPPRGLTGAASEHGVRA